MKYVILFSLLVSAAAADILRKVQEGNEIQYRLESSRTKQKIWYFTSTNNPTNLIRVRRFKDGQPLDMVWSSSKKMGVELYPRIWEGQRLTNEFPAKKQWENEVRNFQFLLANPQEYTEMWEKQQQP